MQYSTLGNSGLLTSRLTLGTMIFGEQSGRATPKNEALKIIDHYLGAGGNHLDTADVYAEGVSEEIVGEAVRNRRHEVLIATKVRFPTGEGVNEAGLSRGHIMDGVHASLRQIGRASCRER